LDRSRVYRTVSNSSASDSRQQVLILAKARLCRNMRLIRSELIRVGTRKKGVTEQIDLQELNPSEAKIIKDLEVISQIMDTVPGILLNVKSNPDQAQETLKILTVTKTKLQPVLSNANKFSINVKEYLQQFSNKLNGSIKRLSDCGELRSQTQQIFVESSTQQTPFDMIKDPFPNHRTPFDLDEESPKESNPFAIKFNSSKIQRGGQDTNPFEIPMSELDNRRLKAQNKTSLQHHEVDFLNLEPTTDNGKTGSPFDLLSLDRGVSKQQNQKTDNLLDLDFLK